MTSVTERAVESGHAGTDLQHIQNLIDHDRNVHSRGRASLADYLFNGFAVFLGIQLLVFLIILSRVLAAVMGPAPVRRCISGRTVRIWSVGVIV